MAILDTNLTLSDQQAVTATAISTNVVAVPAAGTVPLEDNAMRRNWGAGVPLPILLQIDETFATLTSLTITLETSANADLSSSTVLASTGAIPVASLTAGARPGLEYFPSAELLDHVGFRYTVTGSNATAGKITAAIGTTQDANHA